MRNKLLGDRIRSFLQNPVGFAEALAVFRPSSLLRFAL
jgi:hypothetical protein